MSTISLAGVRENGTKSTSAMEGVFCTIYIPLQGNIPLPGKGGQRVHPQWREFFAQFTETVVFTAQPVKQAQPYIGGLEPRPS